MADWRQIRARIRRAKAAPDSSTRLEQLFEKTRDGMVAFELAELEEVAGQIDRATNWYKHAWDRFRRVEWKKKAEDALTRLGAALPSPNTVEPPREASAPEFVPAPVDFAVEQEPETQPEFPPEPTPEPEARVEASPGHARSVSGRTPRRRRRGRRGQGHGRAMNPPQQQPEVPSHPPTRPPTHIPPVPREPEPRTAPERHMSRNSAPSVHVYRRVGEPALASVINGLEAKLRQLLAARPYTMEHVEEVPASPGAYVVSDIDLTTVYYVEAYGNIRVAIEQLLSGRRGRQGSVRSRLAGYLGISDTQATRYLKQHCVVRWLEFEESDAVALGHFATAVLRPELNEETC